MKGVFRAFACATGVSFAFAAVSAYAEMEPATPESQGVSSRAILNWIDACEKTFDGKASGALHGFVIVRHGKVIAEGSWKPFDTLNKTHMLYSHSKSFTSTAIGFLVDAGKLDLDERVADIFPEDLPEKPAEGIREIRIRDLLTMNVGSDLNHDVMKGPDWRKRFFARKLDRKPGTGFRYDSDATYLLAGIVERRTGKPLMEFLRERLFSKIGITGAWSTTSPQGIACGGWGMNMTTRDLAKFGQFYLQKGVWGGKRYLSSEWVALATSRQTWSGWIEIGAKGIGEGSDWEQGYGFQFWRCHHGAYRADGAFGQFTIVMPEQDAVVSIHAGLGDMQKELNLVWEHLLPAFGKESLPEDAAAQAKLKDRLANLELKPVPGGIDGCEKYCWIDYAVRQNPRGIRGVALRKYGKGWYLRFFVRHWPSDWEFPVGCGEWKDGLALIDCENYEDPGMLIGNLPLMASGAMQSDGTLRVRAYLTGTPAHLDFTFSETNGTKVVDGELWGMCGTKFHGEAVRPEPHADLPPLVKEESKTWQEVRGQVLRDFTVNEFGVRPPEAEKPKDLAFKVVAENPCLGGAGVRKTVEISCTGPLAPFAFTAHAYLPKDAKRVPSFVSISLKGRLNAEGFDPEKDDPSILSMPISNLVVRGYGFVTFTNEDIAEDNPKTSWRTGVFKAFGPERRIDGNWGTLSAWAWGASRVMDWIVTQEAFDAKRVAVVGHSRGGKTALWAGVTDPRFALTCVNESGMSGAKLNRMDLPWAESPEFVTSVFPHWFGTLYPWWMENGAPKGYDQHHLLALVAPRKLAVGSGSEDAWAGPAGEKKATELAAEAWGAYGRGGLETNVFYHVRKGPHDLRIEDWEAYLKAMETIR